MHLNEIEEGDIICDIPDAEAYWNLFQILRNEGYKVWQEQSINHYEKYPHVTLYDGQFCCCSNVWSRIKRRIPYTEFLNKVKDAGDWREKLSEEFNDKIASYDS